MPGYIVRRLLLIIPTLWAIVTINFFIVQVAPGGPVDQAIAQAKGLNGPSGAMARVGGASADAGSGAGPATGADKELYRGGRGLDPQVIEEIKKRYGFDKPLLVRYASMLKKYLTFDFGDSLFKGRSVVGLVVERMPVSISLGLWSTLLIYLISIPLGIRKAVRDGGRFDVWTSTAVAVGSAIPAFTFAVILIILFAGGSYLKIFPLRGLVSTDFDALSLGAKILDYARHMVLPVTAMTIGGFAGLTMLTKNSFLDEVNKQYVMTARAKGAGEKRILYGHVFRNAMILIIAGFPAAFIGIFFSGSMIIENVFSIEGLGLLGFEAVVNRDYPVMFGTLYMFTLLGLVLNLVSDLMYTVVDPRIDFEARS